MVITEKDCAPRDRRSVDPWKTVPLVTWLLLTIYSQKKTTPSKPSLNHTIFESLFISCQHFVQLFFIT